MAVKLLVAGANWENKTVPCTFTVTANGAAVAASGPQTYELPAGTTVVEITVKPKEPVYWETTIQFTVASNGIVSPPADKLALVNIVAASAGTAGLTVTVIKLSRFKEVTDRVKDILKGTIPTPRLGKAPGAGELAGTYGTWPPSNLDVNPLPTAHYLDVVNPVMAGQLNFAIDASLIPDVETVVLELAGEPAPRLFGVTWPKVVERKDNASPTQFLIFLRQTGWQDGQFGVFAVTGQPYPYNFDYAERCLFESMHYPPTPLFYSIGWTLRPKGVPYQVAKSKAKVVTVFPVAHADDSIGYGVLSNMVQTGKLLEELQAFMFWHVGIAAPPPSVGNTAIAAYSSATNAVLAKWLVSAKNRTSTNTFFKNTLRAIYFLDPPYVDVCVNAAANWASWAGGDKRIRLYSRKPEKEVEKEAVIAAFRMLLGLKPSAPALPSPPFVMSALGNTRTLAWLPTANWAKWVTAPSGRTLAWWDTHHLIPATVLTHALAQGDFT